MEFSTSPRSRQTSDSKKKVWVIVGVVGLMIGAAIIFWATADNKGVVVKTADSTEKHGPAIKNYSGKYVSFRYDGVYDAKKSDLGDSDLEASILTADTNYEKHLAVAVSQPENGTLDNFSPYTARKSRTDLYTRQDITTAAGPAILFIKNDQTERTLFMTRGAMVLTLSFVSQGGAEELQPEIDQLLTTFRWVQ